jgi:hypothetical protein
VLEEVEAFLKELHFKIKFRENVFFADDRMKNRLALAELREMGFKSDDRIRIILGLTPANYFKGPTKDVQNIPAQGDLWEFGVLIKPKLKKRKAVEYYIKVQLGTPDSNVICISFHPAEFKINYPNLGSHEA